MAAVYETNLEGLTLARRGKVRDIYDLGSELLIVASDRISAYDSILPTPIPDKGKILTALSGFWFEFTRDQAASHLLTADVNEMPGAVRAHADVLAGRAMLVRKCEVVPVECVARGYLAGSGWREYKAGGTVCGQTLREGYVQGDKLDEVLFTPATKAESGHDENVSFETVAEQVGADLAAALRDRTVGIYRAAAEYARARGVIIADTKFEFGLSGGEIILIDEVLTPDSSRFWPADAYTPGQEQASFDK